MINKAIIFSVKKHLGQKRKDGSPYFVHPLRVSLSIENEIEKVCALLHDTVEDTNTTVEEIEEIFGNEVASIIELLTHKNGESYLEYINNIKTNEVAKAVKIADILDNLSDSPSQHAVKKYSIALDILCG